MCQEQTSVTHLQPPLSPCIHRLAQEAGLKALKEGFRWGPGLRGCVALSRLFRPASLRFTPTDKAGTMVSHTCFVVLLEVYVHHANGAGAASHWASTYLA